MLRKFPIIATVAIIAIAIYAVGNALAGSTTAPGSTTTKVSVKVKPGVLSMTADDTASLADVTLDGADKNTSGNLGTIRVTDARGTGDGWYVNVVATDFEEEADPLKTIANTSFTVDSVVVTKITGNGGVTSATGGLSGGGITMLDAAQATKRGRGINDADALLGLDVPADTFVGTYASTVTETLTSH